MSILPKTRLVANGGRARQEKNASGSNKKPAGLSATGATLRVAFRQGKGSSEERKNKIYIVPVSALLGAEAVEHLRHHGIDAELHHLSSHDVPSALVKEARRRHADLMVMGGYGHSRVREWLLGGATYELLRHAPVPLVIAH